MEARLFAWVAVGGAIGAVLRYGVSMAVTKAQFPYGTLVVNVLGSFVLALLLFYDLARGGMGPDARAFLGIGVLGAFTTMSTFSFESLGLWMEGEAAKAAGNVALNVGLSLGAALAGRVVALALAEGVRA